MANCLPYILIFLLLPEAACQSPTATASMEKEPGIQPDTTIYTQYSDRINTYHNFDSPRAINHIADIENKHFRSYESGISPYYGTIWREYQESDSTSPNGYQAYVEELGGKGDSMHCTIYAVRALQAGLGEGFEKLQKSHRRIWGKREHAGWSIGYLLVKEWNWKAYLIIDPHSQELDHCRKAFERKKSYPVWRQPDIPLEAMYILGEDNSSIQGLLNQHEFGWGFSHQGIHTWFTRFDELKECIWVGAPSAKYAISHLPLFRTTPFSDYHDYASHVVIFPPKFDFGHYEKENHPSLHPGIGCVE